MKYYIYIENRMVVEVEGFEAAYAAYTKATELADMTGEIAHLVNGEDGEIIASSDEFWDEEPSDDNLECGFDPYMGCYTDDC